MTRTFDAEADLPRVPLPSLDASCDRFLEWAAPLLTHEERAQTEKAVTEFRTDPGTQRLHAALVEYAAGAPSWLDDFWRTRYLGRRDRIALNANFFFLFREVGGDRVERAAALTAATAAYQRRIVAGEVAPDTRRGVPLSMEQLKWLFAACRIPGAEIDASRTDFPSAQRHVVVFHRGGVFRLDVVAPSGEPHTETEIADGLRAVLAASPETASPETASPETGSPGRGDAVGHLTTGARAEWAAHRTALRALDPANAAACETIETALFAVALEDLVPAGPQEAGDQLLHGDSGNRWFDKPLTLVVFGDGTAGLNVEHCELDGTTVLTFVDAIHGELELPVTPAGAPVVTPVTWVLDDALRAAIDEAGRAFAGYAAATATLGVTVEGFTAGTAKELGCSPDAFVQLAYQLAQHRTKGRLGATYESIATRHFHHGRTEAMRVVTPEIVSLVAALDGGDRDAARDAFHTAARAHVARAKQCQAGDAPEQHLWELQMLARRRGEPEPPALYDSPGWRILRDDHLSTSSVPSSQIRYFGFGSTSPGCIGIGYVLRPDRFDLYLSTPASVREQMTVFAGHLRAVLVELVELLR